jgi:hypothetical protein
LFRDAVVIDKLQLEVRQSAADKPADRSAKQFFGHTVAGGYHRIGVKNNGSRSDQLEKAVDIIIVKVHADSKYSGC